MAKANSTILSIVKRGPKKGLTAHTITDRAKGAYTLNTVRTTLNGLLNDGLVKVVGSESSGGRPSNLYVAS